jgi:hypothetical protein
VVREYTSKANLKVSSSQNPVVFFNASARIDGMSQNAAFAYLTACGLQLAGVRVIQFACKAGMSRCVLGTKVDEPYSPMPCKRCIATSRYLFSNALTIPFVYREDAALAHSLEKLSVAELSEYEYHAGQTVTSTDQANYSTHIPLGSLVLPSLRWTLRRHNLEDDEATRFLFREFILSAYHIACEFNTLLAQAEPQAVVLFNGIMFPEAAARWVAQQRGLRVITHEVALQRFSAFFTAGQATAYPIDIPEDFELSPEQNARLDAYLEKRFQGQFSMAGIRFWPEMHSLDPGFLEKAAAFKQIVPIFTNVIFDTSQVHANLVFLDMFAWLEQVLEIIRVHPETLFVIRAHPDEMRPGSTKQSRETVQAWVERNGVAQLPNVVYIDSLEFVSSYELIQRSKFVMVYNSSIGLEASLLGVAVLCGGKARYTQYPTVFFPQDIPTFRHHAEDFLASEKINIPEQFTRNARRFFYYQLFRTSLPFATFLENEHRAGFVQLKSLSWKSLQLKNSLTIRILTDGILTETPFLLPDDPSNS